MRGSKYSIKENTPIKNWFDTFTLDGRAPRWQWVGGKNIHVEPQFST